MAAEGPEVSPDVVVPEIVDLKTVPLALKLAMILGEIGVRKPDGKNDHFKYPFYSDQQISGIFQPRFAAYGLIMVPEVLDSQIIEGKTNKGGTTYLTNLKVMFTIYDGYTGEKISGVGFGQGDDPGDKGSNKAMTGATKYYLMKLFLIGSESDAEADTSTDERTTAPVRSTVTERRPAQVEKSNAGGEVKKGGRQQSATEAQVMKIRLLAKELKIDAVGIGRIVEKVVDSPVELTAGQEGQDLIKLLGGMSSTDLGEVVTRLETANTRNAQLDADFAQAEALLASGAPTEE